MVQWKGERCDGCQRINEEYKKIVIKRYHKHVHICRILHKLLKYVRFEYRTILSFNLVRHPIYSSCNNLPTSTITIV